MIRVLHILILFLFELNVCFSQDELIFEKEDITFQIKDSVFHVQGIYYFNAKSEMKYSILYPFPTDTIYSKPSEIQVVYVNSGQLINFKMASDSSSIAFQAVINNKQPLLISYQQKLKANKARYILVTTNFWKRPLSQVDYKLITKQGFIVKSFSIPPDNVIQIEDKQIYLWHRENFMPKNDFEIEY